MNFWLILVVCLLCVYDGSNGENLSIATRNEPVLNNTINASDNSPSTRTHQANLVIRKCCPTGQYYDTITHECNIADNDEKFVNNIHQFLLNYQRRNIATFSQKIKTCPGTSDAPSINFIQDSFSYSLLDDGRVLDYDLRVAFNHSNYCLEMVGDSIEMSSLTLVYCLEPQKTVPKCCPEGHYFDTRVVDCSNYYNDVDSKQDELLLQFVSEGTKLSYEKDLVCGDMPVKVNLREALINDTMLCITRSEQCYNIEEFCIDNMLKDDENELVPSAFVCPVNFINKCCPEGLSLQKNGCVEAFRQSLSLVHILKNSRYQVKSVSQLGLECSPITIEDNTKTDLEWKIDKDGFAVIKNFNETIRTRNFCIDDFINDDDVFPVIKVCSEEVKEYHEVSAIENWSENILGKCCPSNMIYVPSVSAEDSSPNCIKDEENISKLLEEEVLKDLNISHLVHTNFPDCSIKEFYHKYDLNPAYHDYAEVTENRNLKIIRKENNCRVKETKVDVSKFCVDYVLKEGEYKPVAIVCAGTANYHSERNAIIVSLVGISCAALISTFFSLVFMRVRRGMVTVKKVNTLAGRILISYVLSQLIGYLILGIGSVADFNEDENKCFVLAGFLMFFLIAAFCWNTSICLEGLLLTMHVQMSENLRYALHSIWSWGVPGIITASALVKDLKRDILPCDSITPKIGVVRCFFSDPLAQLLYFHLPISITVIFNGILLVSAKVIRKKKLKMLEKDPNRVRKHASIQQALSIKSLRNKIRGEPSVKPFSNHSGLRTHHNRNIWIESLKLVVWSGTTWMMEIIGTVVTMYKRSQGEWYNYLWYLPVGFNCLRGLGIFVIITINSDNKVQFIRTARTLSSRFSSTLNKFISTVRFKGSDQYGDGSRFRGSVNGRRRRARTTHFPPPHSEFVSGLNKEKHRSTSVSTIITNISNATTIGSANGEANEIEKARSFSTSTTVTNISNSPSRFSGVSGLSSDDHNDVHKPKFYHSVSQTDNKSRGSPTIPEVFENMEVNASVEADSDQVSLDNTSMENVFWESEFKNKRNNCNVKSECVNCDEVSRKLNTFAQISPSLLKDLDSENVYNKNIGDEIYSEAINGNLGFENYSYCTHL